MEPKLLPECFKCLFGREIGDGEIQMATGETVAQIICGTAVISSGESTPTTGMNTNQILRRGTSTPSKAP